MEIWKDIKGYEGMYQVSNMGRVKSLKHNKEKILKLHKGSRGYLDVKMCNLKQKRFSVHRLVAETFLDNPNNYTEVNHLDENKENNNVTNLEWCNHKYNINYGKRNMKMAYTNSKPVVQLDKNYKIIKSYLSIKMASEVNNIKFANISNICNHIKGKSANGYYWYFLDEYINNTNIPLIE